MSKKEVSQRTLRALQMRQGQREYLRGTDRHRVSAIVARRQYGKTTTFAKIALKKMMKTPNHTVIFGSAKISLSREIVRKEAEVMQAAIALAIAEAKENQIQIAESDTGKIPDKLTPDYFAELFEAQRLEFRYYHSRSVYSRTKVVALRADTVGETGDLMADEIGRVNGWRDVYEAIEPIIASDPNFRLTLSTTVPPDDKHYSFEMLMPPIGQKFPVNPCGNWYKSEMGIWVLRLDAFDAYADNVPVYDSDSGEPLHPAEHRRRSHDKEAWDRNYGCLFLFGGSAACGYVQLDSAQRRGVDQCAYFLIEDDSDMDRALQFLAEHIGEGRVGLGWDLATTENDASNPNGFTVIEERGVEMIARLIVSWKTKDPSVARKYCRALIKAVKSRKQGGPARRLCIDATNERYFAAELRRELAAELPVELVIASETVEIPGKEEKITKKQLLGGELVKELDDNHLWLPPERYIKDDFRRVQKDRGQFVNELGANGEHADTFDSTKYALRALRSTDGAVESVQGIVIGNRRGARNFKPRYLRKASLFIHDTGGMP